MKIETKFSNHDVVWGVQKQYTTDSWIVIGPLTIGQVRVEVTDSNGIEGEETFSNYMDRHERKEQYMCAETGIGSGTLHQEADLFSKKAEAEKAAKKRNEEGKNSG